MINFGGMHMGWLKNQFRKVIQWEDQDESTLVYKYPLEKKQEIMRKSVLVVNPGQKAIFVQEGKIADAFGPGTYELSDIKNIPILTSLYNWKFAWESPYTGDVYFISTKQNINMKWGTTNPVMMRDQDFGMVRVRGFGTYAFSVGTPTKAMDELCGAMGRFTVKHVDDYFRKVITSTLSNVIAESEIPALDLSMHYEELANAAKNRLKDDFANIGIVLNALYIENISLPEEVEKMMDKRTSVGVMQGSMQGYAQMESVAAMRDAAKNPGGMSGIGIGLGAGVGMGKMFADEMKGALSGDEAPAKEPTVKCPSCGYDVKKGAKFCPECGAKMAVATKKFCPNCGKEITGNSKFCPECGAKL